MKKGPLIVLILIILVAGFLLFKKNATAPVDTMGDDNSAIGGTMPALGEEGSPVGDMTGDPADLANQGTVTNIGGTTNITTDPNLKVFIVENQGLKFTPKTLTVKKGDTVQITYKNTGGFHDLVIDEFDAKTPQINAGQEASITFVADKAGTFQYYCSVGEHRAMGMWGTLTVTE